MASKVFMVLCASVFLVQAISAQSCYNPMINLSPCGVCGARIAVPAASGGGLAVSSASPLAASGISVVSQNAIQGALSVAGSLPFLGTVALQGAMPSAGAATVNYSCGNGNVAVAERAASGAPAPYSAAASAGLAGSGILSPAYYQALC